MRLVILAVGAGWAVPCPAQSPASTNVTRFATNEFIAGLCIRPRAFIDHPSVGTLPIYEYLPEPLSLGRLKELNVEELAVFCAPAVNTSANNLQWAAAVRAAAPIKLPTAIPAWRRSLVPTETERIPKAVAVQIEGRECFQIPAGTFLPPSRAFGQLHFTDRRGDAQDKGTSVGRLDETRGYVEGGTESSAVFTFEEIDAADLIDGHLPLELRADVYRTYFLDQPFSTAQIQLRNPAGRLACKPIEFAAKSYVNQRINIPRKLTAEDGRQLDILKDLTANGRIEVVIQHTRQGVYLGVGPQDLNLRRQASEYVCVLGREMLVAQSSGTLKRMLQAARKPGWLASQLSPKTADMAVAVSIGNRSQRAALRRLMQAISSDAVEHWGKKLTRLTATVDLSEPRIANMTAEFQSRTATRAAAIRLRDQVAQARRQAKPIEESLNRIQAMCSLISLGMDGIPMVYQSRDDRQPNANAKLLQSTVESTLDGIRAKSEDNVLTVDVEAPTHSNLSPQAQVAFAEADEAIARDLFHRERFDLGDEVFRRATDRLPHVPQAWFRRAHHLAYNISIDFDGYEARYAWVRRGINVLLDGAERNPQSADWLWMAARIIARKIGDADERLAYRRLFSKDIALHKRLAKWIDVKQANSPVHEVDNWLVAKLLFDRCMKHMNKTDLLVSSSPLLFFSRSAATEARYAQSLADAGHWKESHSAWKTAEQLFRELGETQLPTRSGDQIRLKDYEPKLKDLGADHETVKRLRSSRRHIQYDYWLTRCRLEQTDELRQVRKFAHTAAEHARNSEPKQAAKLYRQSLQALAALHENQPRPMQEIIGEFDRLVRAFQQTTDRPREEEPPEIVALIQRIERADPLSRYPLSFPRSDEQDGVEGNSSIFKFLDSDLSTDGKPSR